MAPRGEPAPVHALHPLRARYNPLLPRVTGTTSWRSEHPNTIVPVHSHVEEQFTFVLDGEFEFECDGETRLLRRGSVVHIPAGIPHSFLVPQGKHLTYVLLKIPSR